MSALALDLWVLGQSARTLRYRVLDAHYDVGDSRLAQVVERLAKCATLLETLALEELSVASAET